MSVAAQKTYYWAVKCPACGSAYVKGTSIILNPIECRGKCKGCPRTVRNVYRHLWPTIDPFQRRKDALAFCDAVNEKGVVE
jgi:hypothetical protein